MPVAAQALREGDRWTLMVPSTGYSYGMFQACAIEAGVELMSEDGTEADFALRDGDAAAERAARLSGGRG